MVFERGAGGRVQKKPEEIVPPKKITIAPQVAKALSKTMVGKKLLSSENVIVAQPSPTATTNAEPMLPSDTILTREVLASDALSNYNERGAVIEGKIIPYGQFTVTFEDGRQITPSSKNELVSNLVEQRKKQYYEQGEGFIEQGYTPVQTEEGIRYVKQTPQLLSSDYVPQSGDVQQYPGGPIVNVQPSDIRQGISQSIADMLGISRMDTQEPYVVPGQSRQAMYEAGIVSLGISQQEIATGMLSTLQMPFFIYGAGNLPKVAEAGSLLHKFIIGGSATAGVLFAGGAAKQIIQEPSPVRQQFDVAILAAGLFMGGKVSGLNLSDVSYANLRMIGERIPRSQEVTYFKETGEVNVRNVYDVLGMKVRSPFYKAAVGNKGIDFFSYEMPKDIVIEPKGLAQGPQWKPSTVSGDIIVAMQGKKVFVSPVESTIWQPKTGTAEPITALTYFQKPKPGPITEYDPIYQVVDPYITELNKTLDLLSPNWQPKTGIPFPVEIKPKTIMDIAENKINPLDVIFKPKERITTTTISFDAKGNLVGTKYGLTEPATKQWQPLTGTFEQPPKTGKELWTTVFPKPTPYIAPGKLTIYEPMLDWLGGLESGKTLETENLFKIVSTRKKAFTLQDIIKPVEKPIGTPQTQGGGQETVLIMEEPKVSKQKTIVEQDLMSDVVLDMYTESETALISEQKQYQEPWTEQRFKPMEKQKQDSAMLSMFAPMYESRQEQESISKQEQMNLSKFTSLSLSISDSIQSQILSSDKLFDKIKITEQVSISKIVDTFIDEAIIIQTPFIEKPPEEIITKEPGIPGIPELEEEGLGFGGDQAYVVKVRGKQYSHGRKVGDDSFHRISGPLSFDDAMNKAVAVVGGSEKAAFMLEAVKEKPQKGKMLPSWTNEIFKFNQKDKDTWIEMPSFRIDSSGEIRAITMKGIEARRRF